MIFLTVRDHLTRVVILEIFIPPARREFFKEILYNNIAIIAIQDSKIYLVETFGDFSRTVE